MRRRREKRRRREVRRRSEEHLAVTEQPKPSDGGCGVVKGACVPPRHEAKRPCSSVSEHQTGGQALPPQPAPLQLLPASL